MKITVVGSGAWGTAVAMLLLENGNDVTLWSYFDKETQEMLATRENHFLKGVRLPDELELTSDLGCVAIADMVVMATPSFAVRETARRVGPLLAPNAIVVSISKGIERDTSKVLTDVIEEEIHHSNPVGAVSGPSHAEEVSRRIPTGCVSACGSIELAERVQEIFMNERFRVYASDDIIGVELSAALKNVIAMCAGCIDGMGYGDNTKALLMTRGLTEIARVGDAMGGRKETFAGLAGMGDLIVTCTSMHSRNRRAGILIGKGKSAKEAMDEVGAVVEGYYAAASGHELAQRYGVEMPITEAAYQVCHKGASPKEVMEILMNRPKKHEIEESWL